MSRRLTGVLAIAVALYALAVTVVLVRVERASHHLRVELVKAVDEQNEAQTAAADALRKDLLKELEEMRRGERERYYDLKQLVLLGGTGALQSPKEPAAIPKEKTP